MSSAPRPNKIASILRLPLVSKNLAGTLRQPTYMAIAASLGLHGVVGVGFAVVSPNGFGNSQQATRMVETNLVELTPEEISRLPVVSTLPVGRLPLPNSNALSAGTLPSLSGLPPSASGTSGNSGQGLPPGPPPPLGSSEPTYSSGSFFGSGASGYSGSSDNSGFDYDAGDRFSSQESVEDWLARYYIQNQDFLDNQSRLDNSTSERQKRNLQDEDARKKLPNEENEEDLNGENEEAIGSADSPNAQDPEELIYFVTGSLPPAVPLDLIQGEYPVVVRVDADGNIVGWELRDGSDNAIIEKVIERNLANGFPGTGQEEVYQFAVVFNENSPPLNAGGSEEEELLQLAEIAGNDSDSETTNNADPQILALEPIVYSAANLAVPPEELPDSAIVDIVVTPEGGIEPQLVASTGDETLDIFARDSAFAWALEQKLGLHTPNTYQVTIPIELDGVLDDLETPPEATTPEQIEIEDTEETIEEKPIPPQTPAPEPLEPEQPELEQPELEQPELEQPEPELPQPKIPPSSPNPTAPPREKRPLQDPSEPDDGTEGLPKLPMDEPTQSSTSNEPLPIEKEPLPDSVKALGKQP